ASLQIKSQDQTKRIVFSCRLNDRRKRFKITENLNDFNQSPTLFDKEPIREVARKCSFRLAPSYLSDIHICWI
ncbi:MAG TPA: hypothetical protein VK125_06500, partial [Bacillota bacterium]|nr:hypothetical protein [Bacillota bacterium]